MRRNPLIEISRSEMPKSVVLANILSHRCHLEGLRAHCCPDWKMRPLDGGGSIDLNLGAPNTQFMVTALFHVRRDFKMRCHAFMERYKVYCPNNEIDIVVVLPEVVAIGLELKWKSRIAGLKKQLQKERSCLRLIASYYNCPNVSLAAILPHQREIEEADAVVVLGDAAEFLDRLHQGNPDDWYIKLASEEFRVTGTTRDSGASTWRTYESIEELLALDRAKDGDASNMWVGYIDGLDDLRSKTVAQMRQRPHWKVAGIQLSPNWYPLRDVANIVQGTLDREVDRH